MMFSLHFDNTYKKPPFDKSSLYKFLLKKAGKLLHHPKDNIVLSIKDQYRKDVLDICLRITNEFDLLSLSKKLLREKKSRWGSKSNNIKNGEFIRYHLEAYLFRITTIRDLILKLLNRVNKLGLKENSYLEFSIKKKSDQTNNIKLSEHIEIVHSVFQEIKPIRNKIAHGACKTNKK